MKRFVRSALVAKISLIVTALSVSAGEDVEIAGPFPAPNRTSGMDVDGNEILMVSEDAGLLYVLDLESRSVKRVMDLPGISDRDPGSWGIAVGDGAWWHSDYQRRRLYKIHPEDGRVLAEFRTTVSFFGLAWDGEDLWGVSIDTKELFRVNTDDGSILQIVPLSGVSGPIGLTWDGESFWITDGNRSEFYRINRSGETLRTVSSQPGCSLSGIFIQTPFAWIGCVFDAVFYRYDVGVTETEDCDGNGVPDNAEILADQDRDCDANGILDVCDLIEQASRDCNGNSIPDECDLRPFSVRFLSPRTFGAREGPHSIVAADLNGDGILDLATANDSSENVSVLIGRAGGSFRQQQRYATGDYPASIGHRRYPDW